MSRFLRRSCRLAAWLTLVAGCTCATRAGTPATTGTSPYWMAGAYKRVDPTPASAQPTNGLDPGSCSSCYDDCGLCLDPCVDPQWAVTAGVLLMTRTNPDHDPLYQDNIDPLFGSDYHQGWESGFQIEMARRNINHGDELVARFFWIDGWSAHATADVPGDTQISSNPPIGVIGPRHVASRMDSEINSFELNYYLQSNWAPALRWIVGFRAVELDETIGTTMIYPGGGYPNVYHTVDARNRLYGAQVGAELRLLEYSRFSLKGFLLGGIYGNAARNTSAAWDDFTAPVMVNDGGHVTSFVGETGLSGFYQLNDHWQVRLDYRVLAVSGVALATEQVAVSNFDAGTGYDTDDSVFYHGLFLGLDFAF